MIMVDLLIYMNNYLYNIKLYYNKKFKLKFITPLMFFKNILNFNF